MVKQRILKHHTFHRKSQMKKILFFAIFFHYFYPLFYPSLGVTVLIVSPNFSRIRLGYKQFTSSCFYQRRN